MGRSETWSKYFGRNSQKLESFMINGCLYAASNFRAQPFFFVVLFITCFRLDTRCSYDCIGTSGKNCQNINEGVLVKTTAESIWLDNLFAVITHYQKQLKANILLYSHSITQAQKADQGGHPQTSTPNQPWLPRPPRPESPGIVAKTAKTTKILIYNNQSVFQKWVS